jgi:DNA-binding GntR family transcriptional regulator
VATTERSITEDETARSIPGVARLPDGATLHVSDHVYRMLRHAVVSGAMPPGTRIVEAALASQLEVSRTPIRDALRRLEGDGLLERSGARGLVVSTLTADDIEDIFLLRATLDRAVAKLLVHRTVDGDWVKLREDAVVLDALEAESGTGSFEFAEAHNALHEAIYRLAFAPRVAGMLSDRLLVLIEIAAELSYAGGARKVPPSNHLGLIDALASGNVRIAVAAADEHCWEAHRAAVPTAGRRRRRGV